MNAQELRDKQQPLKKQYRENPKSALYLLHAEGRLHQDRIAVKILSGAAGKEVGLHPATGGDGSFACSGDMVLEALTACAGVTLLAVATAMDIHIRDGTVKAEGDLDFRGTLGVARDVRHFGLDQDPPLFIYLPMEQLPFDIPIALIILGAGAWYVYHHIKNFREANRRTANEPAD